MRIRRAVGFIAIAGVLLHALALVRHQAVMMTDALPRSPLAEDALRADLTFPFGKLPICRGNAADSVGDLESSSESGGNGPAPSQRGAPCAVCSGSVAAYTVAPSPFTILVLPRTGSLAPPVAPDHPLEAERCAHPLARGPPSTA